MPIQQLRYPISPSRSYEKLTGRICLFKRGCAHARRIEFVFSASTDNGLFNGSHQKLPTGNRKFTTTATMTAEKGTGGVSKPRYCVLCINISFLILSDDHQPAALYCIYISKTF